MLKRPQEEVPNLFRPIPKWRVHQGNSLHSL